MISYLLSGWRVFVPDANGQPLYRGRVYFYDASTSEPSAVFADKEKSTSLGTSVDVGNDGFIPAIWLDASHLYKVVIKRLIQEDPETWETLWEINDVGNPFLTYNDDIGTNALNFVNTISDLRNIDPRDPGRPNFIYVLGWYVPGDTGSPMLFKWTPGGYGNDGHWITPSMTSVGAWEQIFEGELDPRKFGAVPDSGNACDTSLVKCMNYACEPHVYDSGDSTTYYPKTVHFVKEGTYKLNAAFDFSIYKMIAQYAEAPVPVVIDEGVYFDDSVTLGKSCRINSSRPFYNVISRPPTFVNDDGYIKFSWFRIPYHANSEYQSPKVVVIDKDSRGTQVKLNNRLVINLLDSLPSNLEMTDCILINAKGGLVHPTLLQLGEYVISHGRDDQYSYDILELKDGNGDAIFHIHGDVPSFDKKLSVLDGFKVDNNNYLNYSSSQWNLVIDHIQSQNITGQFKGSVYPQQHQSYIEFEMKGVGTSGVETFSTNFALGDGQLGYIVLVYETAGAYMLGYVNVLAINKRIVFNVSGIGSQSTHKVIERWNMLVTVMRRGENLHVSIPRRINTITDGNDTENSCLITWRVENIT